MSEHVLNRRKEDAISQKTPVSLGFAFALFCAVGSGAWAIWTYFDTRMNTMEQAVYQMSGDVHKISGEMDILLSENKK